MSQEPLPNAEIVYKKIAFFTLIINIIYLFFVISKYIFNGFSNLPTSGSPRGVWDSPYAGPNTDILGGSIEEVEISVIVLIRLGIPVYIIKGWNSYLKGDYSSSFGTAFLGFIFVKIYLFGL